MVMYIFFLIFLFSITLISANNKLCTPTKLNEDHMREVGRNRNIRTCVNHTLPICDPMNILPQEKFRELYEMLTIGTECNETDRIGFYIEKVYTSSKNMIEDAAKRKQQSEIAYRTWMMPDCPLSIVYSIWLYPDGKIGCSPHNVQCSNLTYYDTKPICEAAIKMNLRFDDFLLKVAFLTREKLAVNMGRMQKSEIGTFFILIISLTVLIVMIIIITVILWKPKNRRHSSPPSLPNEDMESTSLKTSNPLSAEEEVKQKFVQINEKKGTDPVDGGEGAALIMANLPPNPEMDVQKASVESEKARQRGIEILTRPTVINYDENDFEVLRKTIWAEARGEELDGQIGVAWVIINRARRNLPLWGGNSIAGVCKQKSQFACWNKSDDITINEDKNVYNDMDQWLRDLLNGKDHPDNTEGSDHFNNPDMENPEWAKNISKKVKIGKHQFYKQF